MDVKDTENLIEMLSDGLSYKDRVQMLMNGAISFCTILLAEGCEDSEAAARAAEISAELLDRVEYEVEKHDAELMSEMAEDGEPQEESEDGDDD